MPAPGYLNSGVLPAGKEAAIRRQGELSQPGVENLDPVTQPDSQKQQEAKPGSNTAILGFPELFRRRHSGGRF